MTLAVGSGSLRRGEQHLQNEWRQKRKAQGQSMWVPITQKSGRSRWGQVRQKGSSESTTQRTKSKRTWTGAECRWKERVSKWREGSLLINTVHRCSKMRSENRLLDLVVWRPWCPWKEQGRKENKSLKRLKEWLRNCEEQVDRALWA